MKSKIIGKCICCQGKLNSLFTLNNMPSQVQHLPSYENLNKDLGEDLVLSKCDNCGLLQFDTEPVWYYKDVIRAGGGTSTMRNLRISEYRRFIQLINDNGYECNKLVEIGCGQGEFLRFWNECSDICPKYVCGIEHDESLVQKACNFGVNVRKDFMDDNCILEDGPFDAFVQFNFLEHQPDPVGMLKAIRNNVTPEGFGLITVPSLEYILKYDGYYELMKDHIAYYSIESLTNVVKMAGFEPLEHRIINRDTIEMIVKVDKNPKHKTLKANTDLSLKNLEDNYAQLRIEADSIFKENIAIWGASHQAFTFLSTTNLSKKVMYIIDSADFKQGKFSPGSHIKIVSPDYFFDKPVKTILIIAPGYTDEIASTIRKKYGSNIDIKLLKERKITDYI